MHCATKVFPNELESHFGRDGIEATRTDCNCATFHSVRAILNSRIFRKRDFEGYIKHLHKLL